MASRITVLAALAALAVACGKEAGLPPPPNAPVQAPFSAAGSDGLYGVTFDAKDNVYAVGFTSADTSATADRAMVVAKFTPAGVRDTSFGTNGIATVNVAAGGKTAEMARGIVLQSSGKIVVGGIVEHDVAATGAAEADRDVALFRLNADGSLDKTFGKDGIAVLNLNDGVVTQGTNGPVLSAPDAFWSLTRTSDDRLVLHGNTRASGFKDDGVTPRSDNDWVLVRLTPDGAYDTSFGTEGKFTLDIGKVNGTARAANVLPDGSIIACGYANTPSTNSTQPVVYKVTPAGKLDTSFGNGGVFHEIVLAAAAEAYGAALVGGKLVTAGYGRSTTSESLDWLSLRFNPDGKLDPTWGSSGVVRIDVGGFNDNARDILALPDGRVLLLGGGQPTSGNMDAMIAILKQDGSPDESFAPKGYKTFDLGGASDFFWKGAVSPDGKRVALAGLKGVASASASPTNNDDAVVHIIKIAD